MPEVRSRIALSKIARVPGHVVGRMTQQHLDVLQNIEFVLVEHYRRSKGIDDQVVLFALFAAVNGDTPDDEAPRDIIASLAEIRALRSDVTDSIWTEGLRVVAWSVLNHSRAQAGDVAYLEFLEPYMK